MFREYEDEEWATIHGYPNYEISNYGRVWSIVNSCFLKPWDNGFGYVYVRLFQNGRHADKRVHRLVAEAFLPYRPDASEVNHIDGDKYYNVTDNLEWVTASENVKHAFSEGLRIHTGGVKKRKILIVETNQTFDSLTDCAMLIRGSQTGINNCLSGRQKTHRGFTFEYVD